MKLLSKIFFQSKWISLFKQFSSQSSKFFVDSNRRGKENYKRRTAFFLFVDRSFHSGNFTSRRQRGHSLLSNARLEKANVRESVGRRRGANLLRLEPCLGRSDNAQLLQQIHQQLLQGLVDRRRQQYRHFLLRWLRHFLCDRFPGSRARRPCRVCRRSGCWISVHCLPWGTWIKNYY